MSIKPVHVGDGSHSPKKIARLCSNGTDVGVTVMFKVAGDVYTNHTPRVIGSMAQKEVLKSVNAPVVSPKNPVF